MSSARSTPGAHGVTSWKLRIANAHLIIGRRAVLIDTGPTSASSQLRRRLRAATIDPRDLGAVVLTHAHSDHAGNAAFFAEHNVPVVLGTGDTMIATSGKNPPLQPTGPAGRLLNRVIAHEFPSFSPSHTVDSTVNLSAFGIDAEFRVVGGHTSGSGVVVSDGVIAVGDLLRGGFLGGGVRSGVANVHYFSPDPKTDLEHILRLVDELRPRAILLGHGGPLDADTSRRRIEQLLARLERAAPPSHHHANET